MVIENSYISNDQESINQGTSGLNQIDDFGQMAKPLERLCASVIDIISVLTPAIMLITSPIKRQVLESTILGNEYEIIFWFVVSAIIVFATSVVYQTFFVYVYGATLGKLIFQLRVINVWKKRKLNLGESFIRGVVWSLEALLVFLPNLSILSNHLRRGYHDKLSDSHVICLRKGGFSLSPTDFEKSFVRGVFSSIIVFITVFLVSQVFSAFYLLKDYNYQSSVFEESGELCKEVGVASKKWPQENEVDPHRLSVAISLFSSGEVSKNCLDKEADFAFQFEENMDLANLAKAFVHFHESEISNAYLEKTCLIDSSGDACRLSKNVENWDKKGREEFISAINHKTPIFYKLWAARDMVENGEYVASLKLMKSIGLLPPVSGFLTTLKAKVYMSLGKNDEFEISAQSVYENANIATKKRLSRWSCYRKLVINCDSKSNQHCGIFLESYQNEAYDRTDVFLTSLRLNQCNNNKKNSMSGVFKDMALKTSRSSHLKYLKMLNNKSKRKLFSFLEESLDDELKGDAVAELLNQKLSYAEIEILQKSWSKLTRGLLWLDLGKKLYNKSFSVNKKIAFNIGESIFKFEASNGTFRNDFLKQLVITGYQLKKYKKSYVVLGKIKTSQNNTNSRSLASIKTSFKAVEKRLNRKFRK